MNRRDDNNGTGCLAIVLLIVFLMPIAGIILLCSESREKKILGAVLLIIGIIIWIFAFKGGA